MEDEDPLSLLDDRPGAFDRRAVTVPAGGTHPFDAAEWRDALVVVAQGAIELEALSGVRLRLDRGAVLWLAGLPLRALHNRGAEPAVLAAVARRARPR